MRSNYLNIKNVKKTIIIISVSIHYYFPKITKPIHISIANPINKPTFKKCHKYI